MFGHVEVKSFTHGPPELDVMSVTCLYFPWQALFANKGGLSWLSLTVHGLRSIQIWLGKSSENILYSKHEHSSMDKVISVVNLINHIRPLAAELVVMYTDLHANFDQIQTTGI